jgi:RHS repeat-associated protein
LQQRNVFSGACNTERLYFGGKHVRTQAAPRQTDYAGVVIDWAVPVTVDRLGSAGTYYPYGEARSSPSEFATYQRDNTGLDYAQNRYYSSQIARFTTADPYKASGGPADPQSWNRYAYVHGDPINFGDPNGLDECAAQYGTPCFSTTGTAQTPGDPTTTSPTAWGASVFGGDYGVPEVVPVNTEGVFDGTVVVRPRKRKLSPREKEERRRDQLTEGIYEAGKADPVFGGAVLDCIAGAETSWTITATRGSGSSQRIGLYQFNAATWAATGTDIDFRTGSADANLSSVVEIAALYRALAQVVAPGSTSTYTDAQIQEAIRRAGDGTVAYANAVWNCAQAMKSGNVAGAISIIDAFHTP